MRVRLDRNAQNDFPQQLLNLGDGVFPSTNLRTNTTEIILQESLGQIVHSLEHLIDAVYPALESFPERDFQWICSRAIVSPRNQTVNEINNLIIQKFPGNFKIYKSIDTVVN